MPGRRGAVNRTTRHEAAAPRWTKGDATLHTSRRLRRCPSPSANGSQRTAAISLTSRATRDLVDRANPSKRSSVMNRLADLILSHKRLVIAFWVVVTVAAFAAVGPAGGSLSPQFHIPRRGGYGSTKGIA